MGNMTEILDQDGRYVGRHQKAKKILEILRDGFAPDLSTYRCLDLGCGAGIISKELSAHFKSMLAVDLDLPALQQAQAEHGDALSFTFADGGRLPLADESMDVIICAQVYEHTLDQWAMAREIQRVLRPSGVCFFSGPNKLTILEEHYWLPFLSWIPQRMAGQYMKIFGRGSYYDIAPLSYWQLQGLWHSFQIQDYTMRLIGESERFGMGATVRKFKWVAQLPKPILTILLLFMPNYNWLLFKRS